MHLGCTLITLYALEDSQSPGLDPPSLSVVHQNLLAIHSTSPLSFRIFDVGDIGTGPRLFDNRQEAFYDNADLMEV